MENRFRQIAAEVFVTDPVPDAHDGPLENSVQALGRVDVSAQARAFVVAGKLFRRMIDSDVASLHAANSEIGGKFVGRDDGAAFNPMKDELGYPFRAVRSER